MYELTALVLQKLTLDFVEIVRLTFALGFSTIQRELDFGACNICFCLDR